MPVILTHSEEETILSKSYTLLLTDSRPDEREPLIKPNKSITIPVTSSSKSATEPSPPPKEPPPHWFGPLLVILSAMAFATDAFLIRVAESRYQFPSLNASFIIFLTTTLISITYSCLFTSLSTIKRSVNSKSRISLLLLRGITGALACVTCYMSYDYLPVGDAVAIYNVCPALTVLVALIFLKEKAGATEAVSICLAICGAALVAQPGSGMSEGDIRIRMIGCMYALGDAILSAFAYTIVRFLGANVHFSLSVGAVGLCGTIATAILGGANESPITLAKEYGAGFVAVVLAAVFLFIAQSLLDAGLGYCPAARAMLLRTLEVPFAYSFGMIFLGETLDLPRAVGSALVVSAACVIAVKPKQP